MADPVQIAPLLHAIWAASGALTALVPAVRFITGDVQQEGISLPYVTVNFDQTKLTETSSARVDKGTVFFDVFSASEATADSIARTITEAFVTTNNGHHTSGAVTCDFDSASSPLREQTDLDRWHLQLTVQAVAQALI
jgi:hypothetical protein